MNVLIVAVRFMDVLVNSGETTSNHIEVIVLGGRIDWFIRNKFIGKFGVLSKTGTEGTCSPGGKTTLFPYRLASSWR
jgi:hypothetical protein